MLETVGDDDTSARGVSGPVELLQARVDMYPGEPALAVGAAVLSYGNWLQRALRAADLLTAAGVRPDDVVLLRFSLDTFLDYAVAYIATLAVGAVAVPLAAETTVARAAQVGATCQASWLVTTAADGSGQLTAEHTGRPGARDQGAEISSSAALPSSSGALPRSAADVAEILFTSGSTGDPQGVLCPYGEIGFAFDLTPPADAGAPGRGVDLHAAAFGTNFCQEMLRSPLNWGSLVVTLPCFSAESVREAIDRHGVGTLRLTPVMARRLVRKGPAEPGGLAGIREISVSSAFCPPDVLSRLQAVAPNAKIVNQYSLTESGRAKIKSVWGTDPADSLGKPVEGSEVRIVGDDGPRAPNEVGEIQIRHVEAISRGYLPAPGPGDAGLRVGEKAGWISTGDLGYVSDSGYVYLVDRAKDMINVGGRKVSPLAVELAIGRTPGVADAAVCGIPHESLGEIVAAMIVLEAGVAVRPEFELLDVLQPHEVPKVFVIADEVPRNPAGKISRDQVRSAIAVRDRPADYAAHGPDDDELADVFRDICSQALERPIQGLQSCWFDEGGDSLSAVELLAALEDRFGLEVELSEELFFGECNLHDILDAVRAQVGTP